MDFNSMFHQICDIVRRGCFDKTHLTVDGKNNFIFKIKTENYSNYYNAGIPDDIGVRFICGGGIIYVKLISNYENDAKNFISEDYTFDQLIKEMNEKSFDMQKFKVSNIHINDN